MRDDRKPDRDDDPCQGAKLPKPRPKGGDALRPASVDLEARRLALWLRYHAPAAA